MKRMKAPAGVTSVSVAGIEYIVKDGVVEIDDTLSDQLIPHGFSDGLPVITDDRSRLVNHMVNRARIAIESLDTETLSAGAAISTESFEKFWSMFGDGLKRLPNFKYAPQQEAPVVEHEKAPAEKPKKVEKPTEAQA